MTPDEEYEFRFRIGQPDGEAELDDVVRVMLRELLTIVEFTWQGEPVRVDGYAYFNDPENVRRIFDAPMEAHHT